MKKYKLDCLSFEFSHLISIYFLKAFRMIKVSVLLFLYVVVCVAKHSDHHYDNGGHNSYNGGQIPYGYNRANSYSSGSSSNNVGSWGQPPYEHPNQGHNVPTHAPAYPPSHQHPVNTGYFSGDHGNPNKKNSGLMHILTQLASGHLDKIIKKFTNK